MSKEREVAEFLKADAELIAIASGGIYYDQELGIDGLRRDDDSVSSNAFDEDGFLKPTLIVRELTEEPFYGLYQHKDQLMSVRQVIEIYFYQYKDHDKIDLAKERVFKLLQGVRVGKMYPFSYVSSTGYLYDGGSVYNSLMLRQDWQLVRIKRAAV